MVQVIRTEGTVLVVTSTNEAQRVVNGMTLEPTATLVAPQGAIVVLEDGTQLVVPQGAPIGVEVLLAESRGEAPVDPAVEALREAIARGEDPTAIQEAPAAGESGGAPGSSRSGFLDASGVGREGRVERTSYEYEGGFTDPEFNDEDEDGLDLDPTLPTEVVLSLSVDAPALTSDTTPTIVGTTDAEDGSTVTLVITDSDGNEQTVTATVENGTYSVDAETPLIEGEYSVEASVTDPAGNTATSNDVGEIDSSAPALTVDAPALTSDTTPTIVGTTDAEDGSTVTLVITDSDGNEQTVTAIVENGTYSVDAETPLSEGEYSVEASVTDPAGNTATSNDVGEIDASAPALTVDAPALTSDTTPTIVGTTDAEDGSTVTLVITDSDGNEQTVTATVENGTYSVDAETPLIEGEYSVDASVSDPAGNTATSTDTGEIDLSAPALTVDAPALTSDTTPTIVGTTDAEDGSAVKLVITDSDGNEQTITATVENGTYSVDAETPLIEGEYSVEASVTDPAGNTATSNDVGEIDASAPALTVDAPALTSDTTPTIVGTTDAEDGSTVTLVITDSDGNEQTVTATVENGTYSVDAETPLIEGEYSVEASVTDPAGNTATSNDVGEIDASAPALTVDAPALTSDTTPTIVGTTDAEDSSTVTLVITDSDGNEQTVTATVENGTYSVDAETPLSEGEYSVEASVTDPAGNTATSSDVGEIDASAPALTVDAPALTSDTTPTIVGTTDAEDGSAVKLVITDSDGNEQTVTATVENGTYTVDAETPLSEGEYSVEASVTDPAGNTATSNDVGALIGGDSGEVTEDGVTEASGALVDVESTDVVAGTQSDDYGTFSVNEAGEWTYTLDNEAAVVQGLNEGDTVSQSFLVTLSDGSTTTVDILITGVDDGVPTITSLDEQSVTEATGGTVTDTFQVEADAGIASVTVNGTDITGATETDPVEITTDEGTLTITDYAADGTVTYSYVEDGASEDHTAGDITDSFTVVVTDITGQSTSDSLDIAILDTAPVANADARNIGEDTTAALDGNVIDGANDTADTLGADATTVTDVDGSTVTADAAAVVTGDYGTLTLEADGSYSYVLDNSNAEVQGLDDGASLTDVFSYTITDADGDTSSTTLTITVDGSTDGAPTITDISATADNSVTEATGDTVTGSFTVAATAGVAAVTIDGIDISDASTTPVVITTDEGTLTITDYAADGTVTYSYVEDGVSEDHTAGDITDSFTVVVTDITGQSTSDSLDIAILDTAPVANADARNIGEDTTTALDGNVIDGATDTADTLGADATTVTAVDGSTVTADAATVVTGDYGTLTLEADGSYSYVLDNSNAEVQGLDDGASLIDVFSYTITDADGDTSSTTLTITVDGSTDGAPTITDISATADNSVTEATGDTVTGSFTVAATAGVAAVTIDGIDITDASTTPVVITTDEGTLTITDYAADGTVTYSYVEDGASEDHTAGDITDSFTVVVTDITGQSTSDSLDIAILDTAPVANADARNIGEDTTTALDGNVIDGATDTADTLGADATSVTSVTPDGGSASDVTADAAAVVTGDYGTLTLEADGSYSYVLDTTNPAVQSLDDGESLADVFSYTITDADGDTSSTTLTITVDGSTDGAPTITDISATADNSVTEATGDTVTGSFTVAATAGVAAVTIDGIDITDASTTPVVITTDEGTLTITDYAADGTVTYSYVEDGASEDHTAGDITDSFTVVVTDITGQSTSDSLDIAILDTAPVANADARNIGEDTTTALDGNVIDGATDTADTLGADATTVTAVDGSTVTADAATVVTGDYGTLTLEADGSYSYVLDNSNAEVQGLDDGASLTDVFSYTITDADGDTSSATLTITVDGSTDGAPTITDISATADNSVTEATGDTVTGSFTVAATAGVAAVTIGGIDISDASTTPVEITTDEGTLTVTGYDADTGEVTYSYVEDGESEDHTAGDITDSFTVVVTDITGQSSTDSLDIAILDTAPEANADARNIGEDTTAALDGNVIDGASDTADTLGADATTVTAVDGSTVTADAAAVVTGDYGTLTLEADGSYSYVLDTTNPAVQSLDDGESLADVFSYTITDADGDASSTTLTITVDGSTDGVPTITSLDDQSVTEATGGTVTDTFQVEADAGIASVTVNGTDITGATEADPVEITTDEGTLTITDYAADGTVTYSYAEDGASEDHTAGDITDSFTVVVTDITGQSSSDSLDIAILDTAPVANADTRNIDEDTTAALDGNVIDGANDTADTLGADATTVTAVDGSTVTADAATVVTGDYGTLTLEADGSYSYVLDNSNAEVQGLDDGASLTDVFSYTITDADGDTSSTTLTITVDGSTDGAPTITDISATADNSVTEATGDTVTGSFTVAATAGVAAVTIDGIDISDASTTPVVITTDEGTLTITDYAADGTVTYSYVEDGASEDHTGGDITDSFTVVVTDITGQSTSDSLDIAILDTAPVANADARNIGEDTTAALDGNVIDGANDTADTLGADATTVTDVDGSTVTADAAAVVTGDYGTLTLEADGSYSYVLDNSNAEVQGLDDGASLTDVFSYTITDADGDTSSTTLTITVDGSTDGAPTITDISATADNSVTEATGDTVTGSFTVAATAGVAAVTIDGIDISDASTTPVVITTDEGTLTITDYAADGTVTYSYVEDGVSEDHTAGDITDSFSVVVTDITGQSSSDSLDIAILDTAPEANADARNIGEDTTAALDGNVIDGASDTADTLGADATTVTAVDGSTVTADAAAVVTGDYGTLTLEADGSYSYVLDTTNPAVQSLDDGESLADVFSYTITDADGDTSSTTLTITVDGSTDGVPTITSLDDQSVTEATGATVTDTFQVKADAGIASVTVNGTDITGATEADPVEITTVEGVLSVTGYDADTGTVTYSYVEDGVSEDHTAGDITDSFSVVVTDITGQSSSDSLDIAILDTAPVANADTRNIGEDTTTALDGNVIDGATDTADTLGADATTVTDVDGSTVTADAAAVVTGDYGTLTLEADGSYSYVLDNSNAEVQGLDDGASLTDVFSYTITDADGDTSSTTLTITVDGSTDGAPTITDISATADNSVTEATGDTVTGSFTVAATAGVAAVTIDGIDITDASTTPVVITTDEGTLTITDYAADGTVTYSYVEDGASEDHTAGDITDSFTVVVTDITGQSTSDSLDIAILDTAPVANADARNIGEDTTTALDGNVIDGATDTADTLGADATSVTSVTPDGGSASDVTADAAAVVTGDYGTLTLEADGSYSYVLDTTNPAVQSLDDGESLADVFSYTITDADGDTSSTTLTITVDGSTDGAPTITDISATADNSVTEATGDTVTGSFTVAATAGVAAVTIDGIDITDASTTPVVITTDEGTLTITDYAADGTVTYSYVEDGASEDHTAGDITDSFTVVVTDITGQSTSDSLDIAILDTAPVANADARNIGEDTTTALDGNVIDGATDTADTLGADATTVTAVDGSTVTADAATVVTGDYGTLTLEADGSYSYVLDNSNAEVQGLDDGASLTDVFSYTITDADGDTSSATLTITVDGSTDGAPTITDISATADNSVTEATGDTVTGSFTVAATAGVAAVTIDGIDITDASTTPVVITTDEGTLTITDYAADGTVTYSYVEDGASEDHTAGDITDSFTVVVTDITGQSTSDSLDIAILDTAPVANADARNIGEDTTTALDGNVIDGATDTADTLGADATSVTSVTPDGGSASDVTADAAAVVTGDYGTLTLEADGSYSYVLDTTNPAVQSLDDGESLTDVFSYTITDADGDTSSTTLTITVDGSTDGAPTITDISATADNSVTEATGDTVTGSFTVAATAGVAAVTIDGIDITDASTTPVVITTDEGTLTITDYAADGTVTYSYVEDGASEDHTAGDITDSFTVVVTDITGQSTSDSLDIAILDTAPVANADARNIGEDTTTALDGNVIDGATDTADTLGADATSVTSVTPDGGSASDVTADAAAVVTGDYGTLTLEADGSYSYVLDTTNPAVQSLDDGESLADVFSYTITDADGDASSTTLTITVDGSTDGAPTITDISATADNSVTEATGDTVTGSFTVAATAGVAAVTIDGIDITDASTTPVVITTDEGTLTITDYAADGTVTYSYVEDGASEDHTAGDITDSFTVVVTDITGQSTSDSLDIAILDTAPVANADARNIGEDTTTALDGNVIDGATDTADTLGADATTVTAVDGSTVTADAATVVTGDYGTLTLEADGSYSYVLDNSNAEVQGLDDGASLTDVFSYTITDADGDTSSATLTITVDGSTDGAPTITDISATADNSVTEATGDTVTGSFTVAATAGVAAVTIDGIDITDASTTPVVITTDEGTLTITDYAADGTVTYSYVEDGASEDHTAGDITDSFTVVVTDITGQSTSDSLDIAILDTAPVANADARNIGEDTTTALDGNVIDGATDTADTLGADATSVTSVTPDGGSASDVTADAAAVVTGDYGTLTLEADGSYSYVLDTTNPAVQSLDDGESLTDVFSYTITDADGDTSSTTLTITVDGSTDGAPTITDISATADNSVTEATGDTVTGSFTVAATAGVAAVTIDGIDITDASTTPVVITTDEGTLTITDYAADGTVTYSYVEDGASEDHTAGDITDSFTVVVTDITGQSTSDSLDIAILDTAPVANADGRNIGEDTTTALDGNVIDGATDTADTLGADATTVTAVDGSTVTADAATVVTGDYGTLTLEADGSYSYVLDTTNAEVQGLDDGASLTDVFSYTITDADGDTSSTTLTITVDGSTDGAPTITDISATADNSVTEATGDTVTGSFTVAATAGVAAVTIDGIDITDASTTPVVITTDEGTLTITDYAADGTVTYSYVEDGASEDHTAGDITDSFTVVVTDITGQSTSDSLDIAILDTAPVANADARNIGEDTTTALDGNVIDGANDTADTLGADATTVTDVDGSTVTADAAAVVTGDYGTLTLEADGSYSYVLDNSNAEVQGLDDGASLTDVFSYTITDADGDTSSTTLTITVDGSTDGAPTITDISATADNSVTEATGDTVTGSFTVAATAGVAAVTIDGIDITDASTTPVVITTDEGTLTITDYAADGTVTYSYVEDGASEDHTAGDITDSFTVVVTDITGQSTSDSLDIAILDTAPVANADARNIGEDTTTALDGNVIDGATDTADTLGADATTVTAVDGSTVTADAATVVTGDYGTLTLEADGSYSYVLDNSNAEVQGLDDGASLTDVFSYTITDADGDTSSATLTITVDGSTDGAPTITDISATADNSVTEATGDTVTGSFTVAATAGVAAVTIDGIDITDASTTPVVITTDEGTLTITDYAADGTVTYSYVEDGASEDHTAGDITDSFTVVVTDITGQSTSDSLDIAILDTAPVANADARNIGEDTTTALDGNVIDGATDTADTLGADATSVTSVTPDGGSASDVTADAAAVVTGDYGTLTLEADGSYSYVLDTTNPAVQSLDDGESLTDVFSYTITDADGDTSSTTLTITVDGSTDGAPTITDISATADNSVTEATGDTVTGSFTVAATAGVAAVTIDGIDITDASTTPVVITTDEGTLTITDYAADGTVTYSYVEDGASEDHTAGDITDSFTVVVTDITGQSTSDSLDIAILDTAPVANADGRNIGEDTTTALDGNVIDGATDTADTLGADATTVTDVDGSTVTADAAAVVTGDYGTLTLEADGSYSYVLDNSNAEVQGLDDGASLTDVFSYTITDADGDTSSTTLTITVDGSTDGAPTITDISATADNSVTEATGDTVTGSFTVAATAGVAAVTIDGIDITDASTTPVVITTDEGTLTVTGYDADTGEVTYSYVEDGESEDHTDGDITDSFTVVVTDITGQSTSDSLDIAILDTAPVANADARNIGEDTTTALDGNVIDGATDTADTLGADATSVTSVTPDGGSASDVTADAAAVVTGDYGTLTLEADGSYSYVLDNSNAEVQGLDDGASLTDVFSYTITDADGDASSTTLTITVDGSTDGVPTITSLDDQSVTEATGGTVTDTFQVAADAGIASVTINGTDITSASVDNPIVIPGATDDEGTLTITGYDAGTVSYTYVEDGTAADHSAGDDSVFDNYAVVVTDLAGQSTSDSLDVKILDTAPVANDDTYTIREDDTSPDGEPVINTNVISSVVGGGQDELGADGVTITHLDGISLADNEGSVTVDGSYGSLTINTDGTFSYDLDDARAQALGAGDLVKEVFEYTILDADGDSDTADITINVQGLNDKPVAYDDGPIVVEEDTPVSGNVLNNDVDADGDELSVVSFTVDGVTYDPGKTADLGEVGTLLINADGTFTFTPGENYNGPVPDTTYVITDGTEFDEAILSFEDVAAIDDPVVISADDGAVAEDGVMEASGTLTATDVDSDAPTFTPATDDSSLYGTFAVDSDGNWTYTLDNDTAAVQGLTSADTINEQYIVQLSDGSSTTVDIVIKGADDALPVISSLEDRSVTEATGSTLTDTFTVKAAAGIAAVTIAGVDISDANTSPVVISNPDGEGTLTITGYDADTGVVSYSYVEDGTAADHSGGDDSVVDDFAVVVTDLAGQSTTSSLDVTVLDTAPIANADTSSMNENRRAAITGNVVDGSSATADTLGADAVTVTAVTSGSETVAVSDGAAAVITGAYGELALEADGSYSYQSAREDLQYLAAGESVTDVYTYVIADADGDTSSTTLTITINGRNDGPAISVNSGDSASASLTETDSALSTSGTLSVTDVDLSNSVTPSVTSVSSNGDTGALDNDDLLALLGVDAGAIIDDENTEGTLNWSFDSSAAGESFDYLSAGESLVLTYTVTVTDTEGATNTQGIVVTIVGTDDASVISSGSGAVQEDVTLTSSGQLTAVDVDNPALAFEAATLTEDYGQLVVSESGEWTFTLDNDNSVVQALDDGETLVQTFIVQLNDGSETVVNITVQGLGDADQPTVTSSSTSERIFSSGFEGEQILSAISLNNPSDFYLEADGWQPASGANAIEIWNEGDSMGTRWNYDNGVNVTVPIEVAEGNGRQFIELNRVGDNTFLPAQAVGRDVQTDSDKIYVLSLDYSPRPTYDVSVTKITVYYDGAEIGSYEDSSPGLYRDDGGQIIADFDWRTVQFTFQGIDDTSNLVIEATGSGLDSNGRGAFIDDITLDEYDGALAGNSLLLSDFISYDFPDDDGSESQTLSLEGMPDGALVTLSDGVALTPINGGVSFDASDFEGATLSTANDFRGFVNLTVTATAEENGTISEDSSEFSLFFSPSGVNDSIIIGGSGNDSLIGDDGDTNTDERVSPTGSESRDQITGDGADVLVGGQGNDLLTGGKGADVFAWMQGDDVIGSSGKAVDTITDFSVNQGDVLDLSDLLREDEDANSLSSFLHFESDGDGGTNIEVSVDGSEGGNVTQEINLRDVDLTSGGDTDTQIIQSLLDSNSLKTNVDG